MEETKPSAGEPEPSKPLDLGSILDLNFGPDWARKPPAANYRSGSGRPPRPDRFDRDGAPRDRDRGPRRDRPPHGGDRKGPPRGNRAPERREEPYEPPAPPPPVHISLLPQQRVLWGLVREMALSRRAFPLAEIAGLFLNKEDAIEVKMEVNPDAPELFLHQCKICRMVATDRSLIARHIQSGHVEDYFEKQETIAEPPAGQFTCVARCGITGTLLGPPNHHSYSENVRELHQARFSDMPLETFAQSIQTVHDPAVIEQWKEESRKQITYRLKEQPAGTTAEPLRRAEAESWLLEHAVPELILRTRRAIMPKSLSWDMRDRPLARGIRDAWLREKRYPASLLFALRGAFRHRNLHIFRMPNGVNYVTSVMPTPLTRDDNVVESIRELLKCLEQHPRIKRNELVSSLRPGMAPESPEASQLLSPLAWLIDKGHIIEFSDGALLLPPDSGQKPLREVDEETAAPESPAPEAAAPAESAPPLAPTAPDQGTAKTTAP